MIENFEKIKYIITSRKQNDGQNIGNIGNIGLDLPGLV
jgi:hypothetical protein